MSGPSPSYGGRVPRILFSRAVFLGERPDSSSSHPACITTESRPYGRIAGSWEPLRGFANNVLVSLRRKGMSSVHAFTGVGSEVWNQTFMKDVQLRWITTAAVAKGYSDALVRRRSWVRFPSAAPSSTSPISDRCFSHLFCFVPIPLWRRHPPARGL